MKNGIQDNILGEDNMDQVRLNKYLSEAGICSRREADRLIESGCVTVDGVRAVTGMKVSPKQQIQVKGKPVIPEEEMILLAVNKPRGIICTTEKKWGKNNIEDFLNYPKRVFSIGRLDKDSEGLLLMTNNGEILNKIMRAGNYHEKEYEVSVDKRITEDFIRSMSTGVHILDTITRACTVEKMGEKQFRIILTQGLNRQIRRMCETLGYQVRRLRRVRIMNIQLGRLKTGEYRKLTLQEITALNNMLVNSTSETKYHKQSGSNHSRK